MFPSVSDVLAKLILLTRSTLWFHYQYIMAHVQYCCFEHVTMLMLAFSRNHCRAKRQYQRAVTLRETQHHINLQV